MKLISQLPDIDAILVDQRGRMHYSDNLQAAKKMGNSVKPAAEPVAH